MQSFDFIIVGAGSAGCVLARRLSDGKDVRVLLLEAGGHNRHPFISMPRGFSKLFAKPKYFWTYPARAADGQATETWHYGKGLGGSSAVNGMWYMRGMPADFNAWQQAGNPGWGWDAIERVYKSVESYREKGAHGSRGTDGPLQVTQRSYRSPVISAMLAAGEEIGLPRLEDINQVDTEGVGFSQFTVDRRGKRSSSYSAFLKPVRFRSNLVIRHGAEVTRVIIENGRAQGVICCENGVTRTYRAKREIIVSAGAIQSPKLLQLSGVGPPEVLDRAGIPVVQPLDAVGCNLADHPMATITYELKQDHNLHRQFTTCRLYFHALQYFLGFRGFMSTAAVPVTAMASTENNSRWPNVQIGLIPLSIDDHLEGSARAVRRVRRSKPGIMFLGYHLRPLCRGKVRIVSANHRIDPEISMNWREHPEDRATQAEIVRLVRSFARSKALSPFCGAEVNSTNTPCIDGQITNEVELLFKSGLHGNGSCRMGSNPRTSVVDSQLRVHGVRNLRVADASIMPTPVSGNTNATAMVIGARAADFILNT